MSILIRGMEMPTSCYNCNCFIRDSDGSDYCCLLMIDVDPNVDYDEETHRHGECPLIQIPPHGRLGDLDLVKAMIMEYIEEYGTTKDENGYYSEKWCAMKEAEMVIQEAPTIIEAEEGGK